MEINMKKEKLKNLKLLLCALSGSVVIGGCGNAKVNKSVKKEAQSASNIEKTIENNNEISTNEYKEIETTQHNEITEPETKTEVQTEMHTEMQTEVQTEAPAKKLTALNTELHGYSDADKISNYDEEVYNLITSGKADTEIIQSYLIEQVDFVFYGKDICGIYFDDSDLFGQSDKIAEIGAIGRIANDIDSNYPGLIESLPENYIIIIRKVQNDLEYIDEYGLRAFYEKIDENEFENIIEELKGYADINKEKSK